MSGEQTARERLEGLTQQLLARAERNGIEIGEVTNAFVPFAALAICDAIDRNTAALEQSRPAGWSAPRPVPGGTLSAEQMAAVVAESNSPPGEKGDE